MSTLKIFINEEILGQVNYLTITGKLEVAMSKQSNYFVSELIFFSLTEQFNTSSTITMQMKVIDIYNIMYALDEVYRKGVSNYKKFTDSSKSKNSSASNVKYLSIKKDNNKIYLNINIKESNNEKNLMSVHFEEYEIRSIIKTLDIFTKSIKDALYKTQRYYQKINQKNSKEQ